MVLALFAAAARRRDRGLQKSGTTLAKGRTHPPSLPNLQVADRFVKQLSPRLPMKRGHTP